MENQKVKKNDSKIKTLIKNTIIIFFGKLSTQLISFLLLPLYTSYIITSEYGYVDLIITYISLIVIVATLQLDMASFRFLIDYRNEKEGKERVISNVFFCLCIVIMLFTISFVIINNIFNIKYGWIILLVVIFNIISSILLQIARGLGKNIDYAISSAIGGVATVVTNVILIVKLGFGGKGLLITMIVSNLAISLYLIFRLRIYKSIKIKYKSKSTLKELLKYSLPLIPNQISWWIVGTSDRTIVSFFLGTATNGIYSIANKFPTILNGINSVFHLSWTEQAVLHYKEEDRDDFFSTVINNALKIYGTICLLIIVTLPLIFNVLINENYADAYFQIPILLLGILFSIIISLISVVYVAKKMSKELAKTSVITAIINIVVNLILIKFIGLYAASISTFIAYFSVAVNRWFDIKKYITIKLNTKEITILLFSIAIAIYFYYIKMYSVLIFILAIALSIYINKNIIFDFLKNIAKKTLRGV